MKKVQENGTVEGQKYSSLPEGGNLRSQYRLGRKKKKSSSGEGTVSRMKVGAVRDAISLFKTLNLCARVRGGRSADFPLAAGSPSAERED